MAAKNGPVGTFKYSISYPRLTAITNYLKIDNYNDDCVPLANRKKIRYQKKKLSFHLLEKLGRSNFVTVMYTVPYRPKPRSTSHASIAYLNLWCCFVVQAWKHMLSASNTKNRVVNKSLIVIYEWVYLKILKSRGGCNILSQINVKNNSSAYFELTSATVSKKFGYFSHFFLQKVTN